MFLILLGILDTLAGIVLYLNQATSFQILTLVKIFTLYCLVKGLLSLISSFAIGYFLDWMGAIDVISGVTMILILQGYTSDIFVKIGALAIIKGLFTLFFSSAVK